MGLTRAWLRAGASRVVSTYWPTLDDGGALAAAFYRHLLQDAASTAEALRLAQLEMIEQPGWRADPRALKRAHILSSEGLLDAHQQRKLAGLIECLGLRACKRDYAFGI